MLFKDDEATTPEEREKMLRQMMQASAEFYLKAVEIKCHPFIEFTGFMNEWIQLAARAHKAGIDFSQTNTHTGKALPMELYEAQYIGEKFDCIFGPALRQSPKLLEAFLSVLKLPTKKRKKAA